MIFIGIDPGLNGGIATVGDVVNTINIPILSRKKGKGIKREYDIANMRKILKYYKSIAVHIFDAGTDLICYLESVHAMPMQGTVSMFSMGQGLGIWQGLLMGLEIPFELITPQRWKKAMLDGTGKDKEASRLKALQMFPTLTSQLSLKKDEGKAEALLIAEYGRRIYNG